MHFAFLMTELCWLQEGMTTESYSTMCGTGAPTRLEGHLDGVFGLAFAPDDKTLVSTSWDGTIRFWSLANHQVALTLAHDGGPVNSVAFSPDGNLMATSGSDGTARLWPAATLEDIAASEKAKENRK